MTASEPPRPDPERPDESLPRPGGAEEPTRPFPAAEPVAEDATEAPGAGAEPRGLFRSETDRLIAGVCGGIGERYGVEPVIVRLAFLAAVLLGGSGVLFYVAAAILVPRGAAPVAVDGGPPAGPQAPATSALGGALRLLVAIAVGIAILCALAAVAGVSLGVTALFGAWPAAVVLLVIGAVLVVVGGDRRLTGTLLVLAVAIALPATGAMLADVRVDRSAGQRTVHPASLDRARRGYALGAGTLTVDLRDLRLPRDTRAVRIPASVDVGRLAVILPRDRCVAWTVDTRTRVGGNPQILGRYGDGDWSTSGVRRSYTIDADARRDRPRVHLDLKVGAGEIVVGRSGREVRSYAAGPSLPDEADLRTAACRGQRVRGS
ncbi:PspC domain-containing protein [Patulibacter sp. S7RM1-6]